MGISLQKVTGKDRGGTAITAGQLDDEGIHQFLATDNGYRSYPTLFHFTFVFTPANPGS